LLNGVALDAASTAAAGLGTGRAAAQSESATRAERNAMNAVVPLPPVQLAFARYLLAFASLVFVMAAQPARADAPAPEQSAREYEVRFMHEMIDHHMMAVHMGMICLDKAVHQELRATCQDIVTTQQEEIATMQHWLAEWYGVTHQHHDMPPGHHVRMENLSMLSNAEFEIAFMQEMIKHHKMAVVKASQCVNRAYHEELQDMCAEIVSAQMAEIEQMQDWLCLWYGICRPRHRQ
jgi:uncharacterized protein (DUF305 family)